MSKVYYEDYSRISNSSLGWFKISPRYFRDRLDGLIKEPDADYFQLGTMIHMFILEPKEFNKTYLVSKDYKKPSSSQQQKFCEMYVNSTQKNVKLRALEAFKGAYSVVVKDDTKNAEKAIKLALELKSHIKYMRTSDKTIISESQLNFLNEIKQNVIDHKLANKLLFDENEWLHNPSLLTNNEFHINWDITVDDKVVNCKSLLDRLVIDHENKIIKIVDIKTTSSLDFRESFNKYDYTRQIAFYWLAVTNYFLQNFPDKNLSEYKQESYIVTINTINKRVQVYKLKEYNILDKTDEIVLLLSEINWHITNNLWDHSKEYYDGDGSEYLE